MSQLDRTHDYSPEFDQCLQAVLGLARLLSEVEAQRPDGDTSGARVEPCAPPTSFDPASLAVLGLIAVACKLKPMIEGLRTGSPPRLNVGERAAQVGRAGLLR
jgi:hypothetical protein